MHQGIARFLRYTSVGVSTFALDLALLFVLIDVLGVQYLVATACAFVVAVTLNYILSRHVVFFQTDRSHTQGYVGFIVVALIGLALIVGFMELLVGTWGVHYIIARVAVATIVGIWNYLINLYITFNVAGRH